MFVKLVVKETNAHCAAAVTMVAATLTSMDESGVFLTLEMMEVATAFVISAQLVALTVSSGLQQKENEYNT